ncbi:COG3650 family protein [Novosphingobium taihuense]|uniref:Putative membrane protein n=1 Tax=Novosphingobium taihuense TaxID=260085 RepID=A0A7W7AG56_9SPHN|nr:hypothetical protein [Novosphingobium taihuense]MBB4615630.1 putative membrane protein [Novosphingobium taihuense]TWH79563.1 hypothetical protein IQ25_03946 [Novosphingobium taihuense]
MSMPLSRSFRFLPSLTLAMALLASCAKPSPVEPTDAASQSAAATEAPEPTATVADAGAAASAVAVPASFRAIGTEPFWSAKVEGKMLTWSTPEQPDGISLPVSRVDKDGAAILDGLLEGRPLTLEVRSGACSDGMSDTEYPLSVTRRIGTDVQQGCAR